MKARTAPPGYRSAASSRRLRPQILSGFIAPEAIRPSPTALADTAPALPGPPDAASPFPREKAHVALNGLPWAVKPFESHRASVASESASSAQGHARLRSSAD